MNLKKLEEFLIEANKPHANGTAIMKLGSDKSRTIMFQKRNYSMTDNFFGGEPYGGRQVIFYNGNPVWVCVYYGQVSESVTSVGLIYDFLREALQHPPKGKPYRGPEKYTKGELEYQNNVSGKIENFSGREIISKDGDEKYWAQYFGGLVAQRENSSY